MELTSSELSKGQKTAVRILEAAGRCVAKIGADKASITAIAKEAEVKRSLIAYHFPKKDDIFYKVMTHIMGRFSADYLKNRRTDSLPAKEELLELVGIYMDYFEENPHYFHCYLHCFYMASVHKRFKKLNTVITQRIMVRLMTIIRKIGIEQGFDADIDDIRGFAKVVYSNMLATIMSYYTVEHGKTYEEFKANCMEILGDEINLFYDHCERMLYKNNLPTQ